MPICSHCAIEKQEMDFTKNSHSKNGLRSECKECGRARRQERKAIILKKKKEYRQKNKEKIKAYKKAYYQRKKNVKSSNP